MEEWVIYKGGNNVNLEGGSEWSQTLEEGYFLFPKDLPYLEGLSFSSIEVFNASLDGAFEQLAAVVPVCAHESGVDQMVFKGPFQLKPFCNFMKRQDNFQ